MTVFKFAAVAAFAFAALTGIAKADDFVALCVKADQVPGVENPTAEKTCTCASGKVAGADRKLAMDAMKAMIAATASGKPEDAASATANNAKGIEIMMTAEATCL
ncbi:MAG: hypothetical protein WCO00_03530 [Rhodospirillaceae bacterium]